MSVIKQKLMLYGLSFILLLSVITVGANDLPKTRLATQYTAVNRFIQTMVNEHEFNKQDLQALFSQIKFTVWNHTNISPQKRRVKKPITWQKYQTLFLTQNRINNGVIFWQKYQKSLEKAQAKFGVPANIMVAILGIETNYGQNKGKYATLETLTKKAFNGYRRAKFYQKELKDFLLLTRDNGLAPLSISGSHAGAMGYAQFISSSYRHYAIDFDDDGKVDLFHSPQDAIGSIANYFAKHHWQKQAPITHPLPSNALVESFAHQSPVRPKTRIKTWQARQLHIPDEIKTDTKADIIVLNKQAIPQYWMTYHNFYALTRYNHSNLYAMAAYQLSQALSAKRKL